MFSFETVMLGVALAIDAAVVSFAVGLMCTDLPLKKKIIRGGSLGLLFGAFQFLMLWLGSYGGYLFSYSSFGYLFQLVVAAIFLVIGLKVLQESFEDGIKKVEWGIVPLLFLAVATSIDALASGVSLGTLPKPHLDALEVGLITFLLCDIAFCTSFLLKTFPTQWPLRIAAVIFFFLGGKIIFEYIY